MLSRLIWKSIVVRHRRLLVAAVAMLLAASLVTGLLTISMEMQNKAARELEAYGANLLLIPRTVSLPAGAGGMAFGKVEAQGYINEQDLSYLESGEIRGLRSYASYLYSRASAEGQKVIVAGVLFDKLREINPFWQIQGNWPADSLDSTDSIIGSNVAQKLALNTGDQLSLEFKKGKHVFKVVGIAVVGGSEDNQIFIPLRTAQTLSGRQKQVDLVHIRASSEEAPLSDIAARIERAMPYAEARVIGQIAEAEKSILYKIQLLVSLVAALALLAASVAVFSTMSASVMERTREIGLMKALGAGNKRIAAVFISEAVAIGLAGGIAGSIWGLALAQVISKSVFDSFVHPRMLAFVLSFIIAVAVAVLASLWPAYKALSVEPAVSLRGE